jgi:hypothetical protein
MWDSAIYVYFPLILCAALGIGALIISLNPNAQKLRLARRIILTALALSGVIPIYIGASGDNPLQDQIVLYGLAGAALGIIVFIFVDWINPQIKEASRKDQERRLD